MDIQQSGAPVRRAALVFIFVTVAIDILAFGLIIPVLPHLIEGFLGGDVARAAMWVGIFGTVYAAMQFAAAPVQGALSDRYGRRPVILLSSLGLGLDFFLMAVAQTLPLLLVARLISGVTAASFTIANAYIADVTPADRRAAGYGVVGAAFGLGFVLGPALGGVLGDIDVRLPFYAAGGLAVLNFLYGWFVLPESLPPQRRSTRLEWRHASPLGAITLFRRHPQIVGLAAVAGLSAVAHYVLPSTFVLYAWHRYGWDIGTVGWVLAGVGVCSALVQGVLVGPAVRAIGERRTLLLGLCAGAAGFAIYGLAPDGRWFLLGIPVMALWGFASPALQAMLTREVGSSEQGRLQGSLGSLASVAGIVGPLLFATTFATFIAPGSAVDLPGAAFLLASGLLLLAAAVASVVTLSRASRVTA
ncbi:TCR/Tet family MFS transporter [Chiayiivirga flava]|uniref:DHA1 family tetracycline resistance protein-like MFS transporter n=1 Tax=Chiayiivirga flava TaxID=659595 RepID=A0A7W8G0N0_9GAMM|nr:DHA1 family tetracycline resistance protein-like MFS transporter [Chiayiivirga flava]